MSFNDSEKLARYELYKLQSGAMVYKLKAEYHAEEPSHFICAHCYGDGVISILQPAHPNNGFNMLACSVCNSCIASEKLAASPSIKIISQPRRGWHDY